MNLANNRERIAVTDHVGAPNVAVRTLAADVVDAMALDSLFLCRPVSSGEASGRSAYCHRRLTRERLRNRQRGGCTAAPLQ